MCFCEFNSPAVCCICIGNLWNISVLNYVVCVLQAGPVSLSDVEILQLVEGEHIPAYKL